MRAHLISETLVWHDIPSAERVLLRITKLLMPNNRVESESRTQRGEVFVAQTARSVMIVHGKALLSCSLRLNVG